MVFVGAKLAQVGLENGAIDYFHATPVGPISGVFVHANYAEALLGGNYYWPAHELFAYALEILVLLSMAILFAIDMNAWYKMAIVLLASVLFISVGYVLLQNLGIYFDFLIPLVFLLAHASLDQIWEWRRKALDYEKWRRDEPARGELRQIGQPALASEGRDG